MRRDWIAGWLLVVVVVLAVAISWGRMRPTDHSAVPGGTSGPTASGSLQPANGKVAPPFPDLPRDFATMSDVEAAAFLYIDEHLFTRYDSVSAIKNLPCDEGMPDFLLFAADGRVLDVKWDRSSFVARIELVSVGESSAEWNGCTLISAFVKPEVRTDTFDLQLQRDNGRWTVANDELYRASTGDHRPLVGPLMAVGRADWAGLMARADAVRRAHGRPVARPRMASGVTHFTQTLDENLRYPRFDAPCAAGVPAPAPTQSFAELEYVDVTYAPNFTTLRDSSWAIYEPSDSAGMACVRPVHMKYISSEVLHCGGRRDPIFYVYKADSFPDRPLLLVNAVKGLRTGPHAERFSTLQVPGWTDGVLVYSDSGESMRVLESAEGNDRFNLTVQYDGRNYPILHGEIAERWGIYWVGLLNGDNVPDFVLRTARKVDDEIQHTLTLYISTPERVDHTMWLPVSHRLIKRCH